MKQSTLLRFFPIGFVISIALGIASFCAFRALNESSTSEVRKHMILFIVHTVESGPYTETVKSRHLPARQHSFGPNLWILSEQGRILATNTEAPLPIAWNRLKKPIGTHTFTLYYPLFRLVPELTLVKLDATENTYLLIGSQRKPTGSLPWVQISFFFFVAGLAVIIALTLIYFYLRKKSLEARLVLSRLEKGDLKTRFEITRLDEIGSLMLDFNRMASEIERLVHRVQETEKARNSLLAELSHDIRTPLTSLTTSIDTLLEHLEEMPKEEQKEFLKMSRAELTYFFHLIEALFFIADLGEPRYKQTTQAIDMGKLVSEEFKARRKRSIHNENRKIHWKLNLKSTEVEGEDKAPLIFGDPLLIQRLLKNALDNAARYAEFVVRIELQSTETSAVLIIEDDGIGITDTAIALYGHRKNQRTQLTDGNYSISLGLGSVIMKTIVELHGGALTIGRLPLPRHGTRLILELPKKY